MPGMKKPKKKFPSKTKKQPRVTTTGKKTKAGLRRKRSGMTVTGKARQRNGPKKRGRVITSSTNGS